ncbi:MAG: arginase family protein, partial [Boseongicola sp.]|nr:arginase family protein [Boseongicola sp.]
LIDAERSVQIGLRIENDTPMGIHRIGASDVHLRGGAQIAKEIKDIVGDANVYLSFDIDALDPAFAPGTGTPVWAGLTTAQAALILREIAGITLVGGDLVEVCPPFDQSDITAVAGAHVLYELICLWGWTRKT